VEGVLYLSREKKKTETLRELADAAGISVILGDDEELTKRSGSADHRGALLLLEEIPLQYRDSLSFLLKNISAPEALVLLLDGITDPHNFGAILRTADQFQADFVVITERRSAHETQTVVKTSSGAASYVTIATVPNLTNAIELIKKHEFWVYGADLEGERVDTIELKGRVALVLGGEGQGLRRLVRESCDGLISIPSHGHVESFNVSVAAGILMYEIRRQQGFKIQD
jgi:23S rRNA (guanosine2251-2'-O)-methyltransferase